MEDTVKRQVILAKAIVEGDLPKIRELVHQNMEVYGYECVWCLLNDDLGESGHPSLNYTICHGRSGSKHDICSFLLENGADMDIQSSHKHAPLDMVVSLGKETRNTEEYCTLAKLLVDRGVLVELDHLVRIVQASNAPLLRILLSSGNIECDIGDESINILFLDHFVMNLRMAPEVLRILMDSGFVFDLNATDVHGRTALFNLCWVHSYDNPDLLDKISFLIDNGADVNAMSNGSSFAVQGGTPLHAACSGKAYHLGEEWAQMTWEHEQHPEYTFGSLETCDVLQLLLDKGANIHARDLQGRSVIFRAIVERSCEEDWSVEYEHYPIRRKQKAKVIRFLLSNGADLRMTDRMGKTPLMWFAGTYEGGQDFTETLQLILGEKWPCPIDVNEVNERGLSALHIACLMRNSPIVKVLLQHDQLDVNLQSNFGMTPLMLAAKDDGEEDKRDEDDSDAPSFRYYSTFNRETGVCIGMLLGSERKISLNLTNRYNKSALHFAAMNGGTPILKEDDRKASLGIHLLLKQGARTTIVDREGNTPLITAAISEKYDDDAQHLEVIFTLMRHQLGEQGPSMFRPRKVTRKLDDMAFHQTIQQASKRPRLSQTCKPRYPYKYKDSCHLLITKYKGVSVYYIGDNHIGDKILEYEYPDGTSFIAKKPTRKFCKNCFVNKAFPCALHEPELPIGKAATSPKQTLTESADGEPISEISKAVKATSAQEIEDDDNELDEDTKLLIERMAVDETDQDDQATKLMIELMAAEEAEKEVQEQAEQRAFTIGDGISIEEAETSYTNAMAAPALTSKFSTFYVNRPHAHPTDTTTHLQAQCDDQSHAFEEPGVLDNLDSDVASWADDALGDEDQYLDLVMTNTDDQ